MGAVTPGPEARPARAAGPCPRPCPVCGRPAEARYRPFCSRRCADIDLGRWLTGAYVLPGEPAGTGDAPAAGPGPDEPAPDRDR